MAFRTLYEEQNNNMIPGQQIPRIDYSDPNNFARRKPWRNVVGVTEEGAQINVYGATEAKLPRISTQPITQRSPGFKIAGDRYIQSRQQSRPQQPSAPDVTPFLWNMMSSMRDMDTESRGEYLGTVAAGIKDKLDSFAMRLARGIPLTPEQNKRYMSLRDAFNDIQRYSTNQSAYDEYLGKMGSQSPTQYEAWRVGQYRS